MKLKDLEIEELKAGGLIINGEKFHFVNGLYEYEEGQKFLKLYDLLYEAFYPYEYDFSFQSFRDAHQVNNEELFNGYFELYETFGKINIEGREIIDLFDQLEEIGVGR